MKKLSIEDVEFTIEAEQENADISRELSFEVTGADHSEYIKKVLDDDGDNVWLWCSVTIKAKYKSFEGVDHLGQCCYESEEEFKKDGYYEDMKKEAFEDLLANIEHSIKEIQEFL